MALKTEVKDTKETAQVAPEEYVVLELALYTNYKVGTESFVKGKAYKFSKDAAIALLGERDHGRPIWKQHRPAVKKEVRTEVVDASKAKVIFDAEPIHGLPEKPTRVNIGDDSELGDLLNDEDNVQV